VDDITNFDELKEYAEYWGAEVDSLQGKVAEIAEQLEKVTKIVTRLLEHFKL